MKKENRSRPIRVAVGMSGGLDSSAAAALLIDQGYEVIGLTAYMWKDGSRCCSRDDVERARKVCASLGIRHYVLDARDIFEDKIVNPFVAEYASGRTPSPCISCNKFIKFGFLLEQSLQLNCSYLATGHYARKEIRDDGMHLLCARDKQKDQSYFLHRLNQHQLSHILFPLSEMTKEEIKTYSEKRDLPVISWGESQDLCFVENGKYPDFVAEREPSVVKKGEIQDETGAKVGMHDGVHCFTVGQRGGLGIAMGKRMYVRRLDRDRNIVEVAPRSDIMKSECTLRDVHWILGRAPGEKVHCKVRPRYRSREASATVIHYGKTAKVVFDEPQFALTPGQAAVFYNKGEVLGGGWIDKVP